MRKHKFWNAQNLMSLVTLLLAIYAVFTSTRVTGMKDILKGLGQTQENNTRIQSNLQRIASQQVSQLGIAIDQLNKHDDLINELAAQNQALFQLIGDQKALLDISVKQDDVKELDAFWRLNILYWEVLSRLSYVEDILLSESFEYEAKLDFIKEITGLITQGLENDILVQNESLFAEWWVFHQQTINAVSSAEYSRSGFKPLDSIIRNSTQYYTEVDGEIIEQSEESSQFSNFYYYSLFAKTFISRGLDPLIEWDYFRRLSNYYYYDVSNLGRVDTSLASVKRVRELYSRREND